MNRRAALFLLSLLSLGGLWLLATFVINDRYLPSPADVVIGFTREYQSGALLHHSGITLMRVSASFLLAMTIGSAIGFALGRSTLADQFFELWVIIALNVPALVTIVFCYLFFGLNESAAIIAVALNKIPTTAVTIREGTRALDSSLEDVAKIYRINGIRKFKLFFWPQLAPYFASAIRNGLALIWKIVLIVELIGRSDGVGFQIHLNFSQFNLAGILVYALSFMMIIAVIDLFLIRPFFGHAEKWRGAAS